MFTHSRMRFRLFPGRIRTSFKAFAEASNLHKLNDIFKMVSNFFFIETLSKVFEPLSLEKDNCTPGWSCHSSGALPNGLFENEFSYAVLFRDIFRPAKLGFLSVDYWPCLSSRSNLNFSIPVRLWLVTTTLSCKKMF